jgi:hypothetical protein
MLPNILDQKDNYEPQSVYKPLQAVGLAGAKF